MDPASVRDMVVKDGWCKAAGVPFLPWLKGHFVYLEEAVKSRLPYFTVWFLSDSSF